MPKNEFQWKQISTCIHCGAKVLQNEDQQNYRFENGLQDCNHEWEKEEQCHQMKPQYKE